jgi:hypothetical protein
MLDEKWWEVGRLLAVSLIKMAERLEKVQVAHFSAVRVFVIKPKGEKEENTQQLLRFLMSNKFQLNSYTIVSLS